jgi:CheY-like chemotaxis protein/two-component sensor histidine kinase
MCAVIGHELRTLASILKMQMENAARHQNSIDKALFNNTLDQLIDVIDTLRTVSQPEHIANAQLRTVMLSDLISSQISVLKTLTDEHNIKLRSNYQQLSNILLRLPVGPLKQLISNLVRNAVIHAHSKVVDLNVQVEKSTASRAHLTLEVSDDGRGISADEIERLFKPYERGEETFNGSGLGLHVCKTIAELMGGNLSLKPNANSGASFILEWDAELATESDLTTEQSEDPNAVLPGLSVLLVEDDNAILEMTAIMLSDYGVKVRIAKNGLEALKVYNESQTDLVLTDIFMPKMSGVELTAELRRQGTERPIIGLTAATLGQETEAISRAGANAVLNKPLNPVDLARTLIRVAPPSIAHLPKAAAHRILGALISNRPRSCRCHRSAKIKLCNFFIPCQMLTAIKSRPIEKPTLWPTYMATTECLLR